MNVSKLMMIIGMLLSAAGIILVCLFFFGPQKSSWMLAAALGCMVAANVLNVIRIRITGKKK